MNPSVPQHGQRLRVGVTGATGTIGRVLTERLADDFDVKGMSRSLDGTDFLDPDGLAERFEGLDAVVHLAWQYAEHTPSGGGGFYDNLVMNENVYEAAQAAGVPKVVMASSVHADYFYDWRGPGLITPTRPPLGHHAYGCAKVLVEEMGREASASIDGRAGLHVVCIRYGAVTPADEPHPADPWERRVWLSHRDMTDLVRRVVKQDAPRRFLVLYAVSDNEGRVHDVTNPFGWTPRDGAGALG